MTETIDLNADLGEGAGPGRLATDAAILPLVSSANIACGAHAGDPLLMAEVLTLARRHGVTPGAHPGYADRTGFGRRELAASGAEVVVEVLAQVGALHALGRHAGHPVRYLKPHGALYHRLGSDQETARSLAIALVGLWPDLIVLTAGAGAFAREAVSAGLTVAREAFLDRGYQSDGTLVPRGHAGALLHDPAAVADRAERIACDRTVDTVEGTRIPLEADSLCVHGDGPAAVALLEAVRTRFDQRGIAVASFVSSAGSLP